MKGCFFLQRRFAYVGHSMAVLLKERYGVSEFCAYVNMRSSFEFLRAQNEINYTKLLLEEDIYAEYKNERLDPEYLRELEEEYGLPNLWPYLKLDRVLSSSLLLRGYPSDTPLYSHEEMLRILQVTARAIIKFLDEEKPDFIFFSVVSNLGSMLLYHIAKKKGIRTLIMYLPRLGNFYALSDSYDQFRDLERAWRAISAAPAAPENKEKIAWAVNFLHEFQSRPAAYVAESAAAANYLNPVALRRHHFQFLNPRKFIRSLRWLWFSFYSYFTNPHRDDYDVIKPWHEVIDKIKSKYRVLVGAHDLYDKPGFREDFAFFALHVEPEVSPMLLAPFYVDQLWLVKQTARSLPVHFKLYVKDHHKMVGRRPRSFYQELKKIPNVRIIDPLVSGFDLIAKSSLVLTITSTAAWEAILMKKPVIIFSDIFYSRLSMAQVCRDINDLPYLVKKQLTHFVYDEPELTAFLAALRDESAKLDLLQIWDAEGGAQALGKKRQDLVPFVNLLARKLQL